MTTRQWRHISLPWISKDVNEFHGYPCSVRNLMPAPKSVVSQMQDFWFLRQKLYPILKMTRRKWWQEPYLFAGMPQTYCVQTVKNLKIVWILFQINILIISLINFALFCSGLGSVIAIDRLTSLSSRKLGLMHTNRVNIYTNQFNYMDFKFYFTTFMFFWISLNEVIDLNIPMHRYGVWHHRRSCHLYDWI